MPTPSSVCCANYKQSAYPGLELASVIHQQLLRTVDAWVEHHEVIGQALAEAVRPLISEDLLVVFYDMTTIRTEGLSQQTADLRKFGMSKEGIIACQFMLVLMQTAEGIPLYHEGFEINMTEVTTLKTSLQKVWRALPCQTGDCRSRTGATVHRQPC